MLSILDIFRVGIGPSSSHTVGPMRIARRFLAGLNKSGKLDEVERVEVRLLGSLAFTGKGHATDTATMLGLMGLTPDTVDKIDREAELARVREQNRLRLFGDRDIAFDPDTDIVFDYDAPADLPAAAADPAVPLPATQDPAPLPAFEPVQGEPAIGTGASLETEAPKIATSAGAAVLTGG